MLKYAFLIISILCSSFANALVVHGSVFMALGAGTLEYQSNLDKANLAIQQQESTAKLDDFSFVSAEIENDVVSYRFFTPSKINPQCIIALTIDIKSEHVDLIKAVLECYGDQRRPFNS